jgi:hypothetical protein
MGNMSGDLTFKGSAIWDDACTGSADNPVALPTIAGDNLFAYSIQGVQACNVSALFEGFNRESSGTLDFNSSFSAVMPTPPPGGWYYVPEIAQLTGISFVHDTSNHLAIPVQAAKSGGGGEQYYSFSQIASYTVGKDGNISTTNAWQNMPTLANGTLNEMKMAPAGHTYDFGEHDLIALGFRLINMHKYDEAIAVLGRSVEEYPASYNTYDSLAKAYMDNGNTELAIQNYKKSLELNPNNKNGIEMLKKLTAR